ncbi:squalene--hopene cyclase [bacterium]|nr:squalene--hopene cyclase [bacterium]
MTHSSTQEQNPSFRPILGFRRPQEASPLDESSLAVTRALGRSIEHAVSLQQPDGHWCAELEGDTILESEFILMQVILGRWGHGTIRKSARYIVNKQQDDGGWSNFPGGPTDPSVSVKAYFALKLAGYPASEPFMMRAKERIIAVGGAETVNSFTRFYLAALGQIPYSHCPSVPVEILLQPTWSPFHLSKMSSWTRTIVVPLAIVQAHRPVTPIPPELGISELFVVPPDENRLPDLARLKWPFVSWENIFRLVDRSVKLYESRFLGGLRQRAIQAAKDWMIDHFHESDGVGAIFPPMIYTCLALRCLGYPDDSPEMIWAEDQLARLMMEDDTTLRLQPCFSPVWDTTWMMIALGDAGLDPSDPAMDRAADWMLDHEITQPGDWSIRDPQIAPGGWAFEYQNRFYPDLDDTATGLMALRRTSRFFEDRCQGAVERAMAFEIKMQSRDFGWAAFDRDINNPILEAIPFADHNAMLDPSCPDITARVLEMLGEYGYRPGEPFIEGAIRFILAHQEPEGCWWGRWGVNYIYGTWQVLVGLASIGFDMKDPRMVKAADWLASVQQDHGGWGESCASYSDRSQMGQGESTPSQTAWGVLGILAVRGPNDPAVLAGIDYLLHTQNNDGSWTETEFTGTGFPKVFYLRYHYYPLYFPMMAIARYAQAAGIPKPSVTTTTHSLRRSA